MFLLNSRNHLTIATSLSSSCSPSPNRGTPSPEVTVLFCLVPSPKFSQAPEYSLLVHLCRFPVRVQYALSLETFPGSVASATSCVSLHTRHHLSELKHRICLVFLPTSLNQDFQHLACLAFSVIPSQHIKVQEY